MAQHPIPRPEYPRPQMVRDAFLTLFGRGFGNYDTDIEVEVIYDED